MKKLIVSLFAAGGLCLAAGAAFAQGDDTGARGPDYGPVPGTPEYYGNSGATLPDTARPYRGYGDSRDRRDAYGPYAPRDNRPAYPYARPRLGDRDGDGIPDRRDRRPDDPSRY
jgi:hypothetical protein